MPAKSAAKARPARSDAAGKPVGDSSRPAARQIASALRRQIQAGQLQPGEWLREVHVAEEMNTGRSAVREALRLLETDGLVVLEKFRGARVTTPTLYEMFDLFEIRAALFGLVCRFACFRAPDADLRVIVERIRSLVSDAPNTTPEQRVNEGVEIGALIARHAAPDAREMMAASHRKARWHFSYLDVAESGGSYGPLDDWTDLAANLTARNPEGAATAARRIIYFVQQEVTKALVARGAAGAPSQTL
jgi:DNA-binding GntR family transcriptional regulator